MQFKDLPEYAKQAACNTLSDRIIKNPYPKGEAKEIRDAFIALYSEPENAGAYENLDSVAKEATESFLSKKYSPCGTHVGNVYIVYADDISDAHEIGKFKNMFVFAPKGIAAATSKPIFEAPMCKVGGVAYMEVTDAPNEEVAINCNEILSIARSGDGVKITFNNGMQEFVAMDYQMAVNAAWGATNKG